MDAVEFEAAVERGDHASAAALYRGPFLDGFFLRDAAEFERWVERERERLAGCYARELEALAESAEAERDHPAAVHWWKARAAHDPYDSRISLRLMQALEASGNRAAALQHAAIHERLLREEFGIEPDPELAALAERLRAAAVVPLDGDTVRLAGAPMADRAAAASRDIEPEARDPSPSTIWPAENVRASTGRMCRSLQGHAAGDPGRSDGGRRRSDCWHSALWPRYSSLSC